MLKLFAKWLPRLLTIDQNQQRVDDSEQCLVNSTVIKLNFSVDILQWMYHGCFTTLQSSVDSQPSGLNAMNRIRSVERRNGQLASVLWDALVTIFIDYFEKGQNINSEYYMALLEHLNDEIKKKTAQFEEKKCCFIKKMHYVTYQSKRRQNCMN
jgi:hypothetical protein